MYSVYTATMAFKIITHKLLNATNLKIMSIKIKQDYCNMSQPVYVISKHTKTNTIFYLYKKESLYTPTEKKPRKARSDIGLKHKMTKRRSDFGSKHKMTKPRSDKNNKHTSGISV